MNWYDWYAEPWKKYAQFSGRARRREYWTFFLINSLIGVLLSVLRSASGPVILLMSVGFCFSLATFIPNWACAVRRLHDSDKSGWWMLLPIVGGVPGGVMVLLAIMLRDVIPSSLVDAFIFLIRLMFIVGIGGGSIVLLVFLLRDGTPSANKYGVNPKESTGKSAGSQAS